MVKRLTVTLIVTAFLTGIVIWLRSGSSLASELMSLNIDGLYFSITDFFVILCSTLCGYKYGIAMFLAIFGAQAIENGTVTEGLFALFVYFILAMTAGYFSERRWYKNIWLTLLSGLIYTTLLGVAWHIIFIQLYNSETIYTDMSIFSLMLSALPESMLAVAATFLLFKFLPDKGKIYIGNGYLYTEVYESSEERTDKRSSMLGKQITAMTLVEAIVLSLAGVIFSNAQISGLMSERQGNMLINERDTERFEAWRNRAMTFIDGKPDQMPSRKPDEEEADAEAETEEKDSGGEVSEETTGSDGEASGETESTVPAPPQNADTGMTVSDNSLFVMNVQLFFLIMSVAMPIAMVFNGYMIRRVVVPINRLSNAMDKYFSGDEEQREEQIKKLSSIKIRDNNEIGRLYASMKRMISDMSDYISEVRKNQQLEADLKIAEAHSEAKSSFLSNMSHEIRTPINAVLGMNEMILRESRDEQITEYSENIRTAGNTLLGLVNDILDFSKIEAGKLDIIPVDYDVASVLNDLVNMIHSRAEEKGLELIVQVDASTPNFLHGDEIRIKQIITNILTNAVKYTKEGSVTLSVGYTDVPDDEKHVDINVSVKDTGIGIKEEDMSKLFSAFERIEEERNRTIEGTGLGMNITQRLLAMMDSKLNVDSVYGEGSDFYFTVRQEVLKREPIGDFEQALKRSIAERKKYKESFIAPDAQVLVVDDTAMNLTVFKNLLKKTRVNITTAESGDKCLELAAKEKYDIIFLDHMMPKKDGIQTLTELKAMSGCPNAGTPVICLTANAVSGAREKYLDAGFTDYLTKPINPDSLEASMIRYLPEEKVLPVPEDNEDGETAPPVSNTLPDWLNAIEEIDTAAGIKCCGDEEMYLETLTVYAQSVADNADEIERFRAAGDWRDVTVKVHAMKSTSRVVGALKLGDFAERLEKAGNDGDIGTLSEELSTLTGQYRALGEKLSPLLPEENEDESLPIISDDELSDAYSTIYELSCAFDYDSVMFVLDSLKDYRIPKEHKQRYSELKKAAAKPDWDRISELSSPEYRE